MEISWDDSHGEPSHTHTHKLHCQFLVVRSLVSSYDWLACTQHFTAALRICLPRQARFAGNLKSNDQLKKEAPFLLWLSQNT